MRLFAADMPSHHHTVLPKGWQKNYNARSNVGIGDGNETYT